MVALPRHAAVTKFASKLCNSAIKGLTWVSSKLDQCQWQWLFATTALAPDYRFQNAERGIPIWGALTLLYGVIDFAGTWAKAALLSISLTLTGRLAGLCLS